MRYNSLESIGLCKARCIHNNLVVIGRLGYWAGKYFLQEYQDFYDNIESVNYAFRTNSIFIDITTLCEFTKMYARDDCPVFNGDVIKDDNGILYYIYWNPVNSAYVYDVLSLDNAIIDTTSDTNLPSLDIAKTTVIGNVILDSDDFSNMLNKII